jgi:anti-anti-sigma regulatory factor
MDDDFKVVPFKGSQTIEKAEEIKEILLNSLNGKHNEVLINLSLVEKIDLSFLQLLYATGLEGINRHKKVSITGEIPEAILEVVRITGFNTTSSNDSFSLFSDEK